MINLMRERGRIMITEKEVKKYFNSDGVGCIGPCFLGLGLVALIGGDSFSARLFGGFMLIAGILWIGFSTNSLKITDSDVDLYTEEQLKKLQDKGLQKLSLDESELVANSFVITGPIFVFDKNKIVTAGYIRKGNDHRFRFALLKVVVLYLLKEQLMIYQARLNLKDNLVDHESTEEYFYSDIVSLTTAPDDKDDGEVFTIMTSSGSGLKVPLSSSAFPRDKAVLNQVENTVLAIRKMLREAKAR
jgi:hypothetical protein